MSTILVTGPESSGTRILARVVSALVHPSVGVEHRSVPHGGHPRPLNPVWPDLRETQPDWAVISIRMSWSLFRSQIEAGHVDSISAARENVQRAMAHIGSSLAGIPSAYLPYEALLDYSYDAVWGVLFDLAVPLRVSGSWPPSGGPILEGLSLRELPEITDENEKWVKGLLNPSDRVS